MQFECLVVITKVLICPHTVYNAVADYLYDSVDAADKYIATEVSMVDIVNFTRGIYRGVSDTKT